MQGTLTVQNKGKWFFIQPAKTNSHPTHSIPGLGEGETASGGGGGDGGGGLPTVRIKRYNFFGQEFEGH